MKRVCGGRSKVWPVLHRRRPGVITAMHKRTALGYLARVKARGAAYQWTSHSSHHHTLVANKQVLMFLCN